MSWTPEEVKRRLAAFEANHWRRQEERLAHPCTLGDLFVDEFGWEGQVITRCKICGKVYEPFSMPKPLSEHHSWKPYPLPDYP